MQPILHWLQSLGGSADVRHSPRLPEGTTDEQQLPDLVVVCQSWPDEFSSIEVSTCLGDWPLAQWVVCFGSWCESDSRTRGIWPIGLRIPARAAVSRLQRVWEIVRDRRTEPLPVTASRDEAFQFDAACLTAALPRLRDLCRQSVLVRSPDPALREWLQDLVAALGAIPATSEANESPSNGFVIWDVDPDLASASRAILQFRRQCPDLRVLAVMGLAHPEDVESLHAAGAEQIITKLAASSALRSLVDEFASSRGWR